MKTQRLLPLRLPWFLIWLTLLGSTLLGVVNIDYRWIEDNLSYSSGGVLFIAWSLWWFSLAMWIKPTVKKAICVGGLAALYMIIKLMGLNNWLTTSLLISLLTTFLYYWRLK